MIIAALVIVGLCMGSFVNALVWRLHERETRPKVAAKDKNLSITKGRSMCPACRHTLAAADLIPVLSWLALKGKCRYCGKPISVQYPLVELATAGVFTALYLWWPVPFDDVEKVVFTLWLVLVTGLMALLVYDARWRLLPDRLIRPLVGLAALIAVIEIAAADRPVIVFLNVLLAVAVGGGFFLLLFQVSKGKWIGGGDVKLGWLLGLTAGTPARAALLIFMAAFLGTLASLPLLAAGRVKRNSVIPFGPFLIIAAILVQLFGHDILSWYQHTFLSFTV